MKLLKVKPVEAPIMTLGGSPTSVATPPVSERMASAISGGMALIFSLLQILIVTGAIRIMAVTLSITTEISVVKVPR